MKIFQKKLLAPCFIFAVLALGSTSAFSQVSLAIDIAPPGLPVYAQPVCPEDGYIWTPGYWAYGEYGYYWVPGTWVQPPEMGLFWTPSYWGWGGSNFVFHSGYWGSNVGYYGGINYGYGYGGNGYRGGRWQGRHFSYNTAVNNVGSANFHSTYADRTVLNDNTNNVSYNGGNGGVQAQPTAQERQYSSERHIRATSVQVAHARTASQDRGQLATVNGGAPVTPATATPKSYKSVAQRHIASQPLTQQDTIKAQRGTLPKSGTGTSSNPQIKAAKQTSLAGQNTQPPTIHKAAVKPQSHAVTHVAPQPHAVAHVAPQSHPAAHTAPQSHPAAHVAPQSHPVAHTAPQSHPVAHAAPQSHPAVHAKA